MPVKSYLDKILPYLRVLIDENKAYEQKIQIDIGFNMVHISNNRRITDFSRSDNVICKPSSNTNEILGQLLASLYERFQDDIQLSRESSNFVCVRTTCNSRHTILSYSFEIKRENTSRGRKISFEIWRCSKYGKSLTRVCWGFSPYERNSSNKRNVRIVGSRIIQTQVYEIFYQLTFLI